MAFIEVTRIYSKETENGEDTDRYLTEKELQARAVELGQVTYKDVGLPLVINTDNIIALFRQDNSSLAADYNLGYPHGPKTVIQLKDPVDGERSFRIEGEYEMWKERLANL